jgi:YesN/AraC family two-component response regulator
MIKDSADKNKKDIYIMIVDDEEMVLEVTSLIIAKMGFRPLSFSHSPEALNFFKNNYQMIDLVLMDMVMPEMIGKNLFKALREIRPDIKGILLSGWIEEDKAEDAKKIDQWGFQEILRKPIEKEALEKSLERVLAL